MEYRAGEVLSLAVGFKCCWEANQGVEGSENAPEQLKAFCFSVRAQPRNRDSPHMAVGGKVQSRCVFVPVAAQSTSWTTRPEWCWTSWRRWATTCSRWRGWGRRWCGACTSGATRETQYSQRPYEIMKTENGAFGFSKYIDSLFFFFFSLSRENRILKLGLSPTSRLRLCSKGDRSLVLHQHTFQQF